MKRLLSLLALSYLLSSCMAYHHGNMNHAGYPNPNYHKTGKVLVQVHTTRVLGIGGLGTDAMLMEAQQKLEKRHPLRPGESFINHTYDYKHKFFLFGDRTTLSLSAEVIKDNQGPSFPLNDPDFLEGNYLRNGDLVYLLHPNPNRVKKAVVVDYNYNEVANRMELEFYWPNERPKVQSRSLPMQSVFFTEMTIPEAYKAEFDIGHLVFYKKQPYFVSAYRRGSVLLVDESGNQVITEVDSIQTLQE